MLLVHLPRLLNNHIRQEETANPAKENGHRHYIVVRVDVADWNQKAECDLCDIDLRPWAR